MCQIQVEIIHGGNMYFRRLLMKLSIGSKTFWFLIVISLLIVFLCNYEDCKSFYDRNNNMIDILVQFMVFVAAAFAAFANIGMMKSNNDMASVAREEIETLKLNHDYLIAPILRFEGRTFGSGNVKIKNCTSNIAIKVKVFAKLDGNYYVSKTFVIEQQEELNTDLIQIPSLENEFNKTYSTHKNTFNGFEDKFIRFLEKDSSFFVVYIDVEGKIHGTSLMCKKEYSQYPPQYIVEHYNKANPDQQRKVIYEPYYVFGEEQFYIMSEERRH